MQELNRGISMDLARFRVQLFTEERKELTKLKNYIIKYQKSAQKGEYNPNPIPIVQSYHQTACNCAQITINMLDIYQISTHPLFFQWLELGLDDLLRSLDLGVISFALSVKDKIPKNARTQAAMDRLKLEILKKLKILYRHFFSGIKIFRNVCGRIWNIKIQR
jgi:hypothetical protein